MSTSDNIIAAAKSWVGTPYHHQQRLKGVGVDCAQLVAGIAIEVNLLPSDTALPLDYSPEWNIHNEEEKLLEHLESFGCKAKDKGEPGDIICFKVGKAVGHLGILIEDGRYIHAQNLISPYQVTVNTLSGQWLKRVQYFYSFPGA